MSSALTARRTVPLAATGGPRRSPALLLACAGHALLALLLLALPHAPTPVGLERRLAPISVDLLPLAAAPALMAAAPVPTMRVPRQPPPRPLARALPRRPPREAAPAPVPPIETVGAAPVPQPAAPPETQPLATAEPPAMSAGTDAPAVTAPPTTAATTAPPTGAERVLPLPTDYLIEVSRMIRARLDYPWQARRDRAEGTAVVHILLARDGSVIAVSLLRGAHHAALDEEACNVVLRIRKFPELPGEVLGGDRQFAIDQPIRFHAG